MQKLIITIKPVNGNGKVFCAQFDGDFDGSISENLTEIQAFVDQAKPDTVLILDFTKLHYLNSYAIGHLMNWNGHIQTLGGRVLVVGANSNVQEIFQVVGINNILKHFSSVEDAVNSLGQP